ncbi:hypothetical protein SLEP1_g17484 [Rubroshorea leprosula]|uniref:Uncharacterized protein n=1 Tax=Rubroshorea leprosula TaxID=152421 RepID=A0AAV5IUG1_9ROSI|nr:hypothetical protein SLEP1_g17484 [Rubroshorea leprosula]
MASKRCGRPRGGSGVVKHWYFCNPANGVKHWLLLTPASGSLLNTGTITDACQWEFVKHWP